MVRKSNTCGVIAGFLMVSFLLSSCSGGGSDDIDAFIAKTQATKGPRIEPIPDFPPYVSVIYSSAGVRSPFDLPRAAGSDNLQGKEVPPPDETRPKQKLERFNLAQLKMVGTMEQQGVTWALIQDPEGTVHRVKAGAYMGKNYGLVKAVEVNRVELTETVVDGRGGWLERPRSLLMPTD